MVIFSTNVHLRFVLKNLMLRYTLFIREGDLAVLSYTPVTHLTVIYLMAAHTELEYYFPEGEGLLLLNSKPQITCKPYRLYGTVSLSNLYHQDSPLPSTPPKIYRLLQDHGFNSTHLFFRRISIHFNHWKLFFYLKITTLFSPTLCLRPSG